MDASRFDTISRILAQRRTRRQTLASGAGLAAGMAVSPALSQEGTPVVTPVDPTSPHQSASDATGGPEFLFVQPFSSGSWTPKEGVDGVYTLTLTGAAANTVYFSDRPERIFGLAPTGTFLDGLGFTPLNPPNAALVAQREDGNEQEVLVVELLNPAYDGNSLTYDARVLADYGKPGLASAARQQLDYEIPETFASGSLFIDDCADGLYRCVGNMTGTNYGLTEVGNCFDSSEGSCSPCHEPDRYCMDTFPTSCKKATQIDGQTYYSPVCTAEFISCVGSWTSSFDECSA